MQHIYYCVRMKNFIFSRIIGTCIIGGKYDEKDTCHSIITRFVIINADRMS